MFKLRAKAYEANLDYKNRSMNEDESAFADKAELNPINKLKIEENRFDEMIKSYF